MTGETNLAALLKNMAPRLHAGTYVFTTNPTGIPIDQNDIIGLYKESEGTTIILARHKADALKLSYDQIYAWITLEVHSSLEAVGLTAAFSTQLANERISCNVVAGNYHDHLFVPQKDQEAAMQALVALANPQ